MQHSSRRFVLSGSQNLWHLAASLAALWCVLVTASAHSSEEGGPEGADWPQLGGPSRDFSVQAPELSTTWPEGGPKVLWKRDLGAGYSGISVSGDRAFTMFREEDEEVMLAVSLKDGKTLWQKRHPAPLASYHRMEWGVGPHVTPLVADNLVISAGIYGDLRAFDGETGAAVWHKELVRELGGTEMSRGYANSPILVGDLLVTSVGGKGQGLMAFKAATGEIAWKAEDFDNSYSSPLVISLAGQQQLLFFSPKGVVALEPASGKRLWSYDHKTMYGLNVSAPLYSAEDNLLFLSSAYDGGSRVLKLERSSETGETTKIKELWAHKKMRIHIGNAMRVGDVVWGANGDFGGIPFTGVDVNTGEILSRTRDVARTFILLADGKLILLDEDGLLTLATPKREGLTVHATHALFDSKTWTPPTLVGRVLLARDQKVLLALELP